MRGTCIVDCFTSIRPSQLTHGLHMGLEQTRGGLHMFSQVQMLRWPTMTTWLPGLQFGRSEQHARLVHLNPSSNRSNNTNMYQSASYSRASMIIVFISTSSLFVRSTLLLLTLWLVLLVLSIISPYKYSCNLTQYYHHHKYWYHYHNLTTITTTSPLICNYY